MIEKLKNSTGSGDKKSKKAGSSFDPWLALLFVSGCTIASIAIVYRKKKA